MIQPKNIILEKKNLDEKTWNILEKEQCTNNLLCKQCKKKMFDYMVQPKNIILEKKKIEKKRIFLRKAGAQRIF